MRLPRWIVLLSISTAMLGLALWVTHLPRAMPMGLP